MQTIDLAPYCIYATDPASAAQVEYKCVGFELAHVKAVELRMAGFKNVFLSLAETQRDGGIGQPEAGPVTSSA